MSCTIKSDLCLHSGDDLRVVVGVRDQDGQLVDITNVQSITWSLSNSPTTAAIITKTLGAGISIASPTTFVFDLVPADTSALNGSYYQEAEIITSSGLTYTVMNGRVIIKPTLI